MGEKVPSGDPEFREFVAVEWGYRAMFVLLYTYRLRGGADRPLGAPFGEPHGELRAVRRRPLRTQGRRADRPARSGDDDPAGGRHVGGRERPAGPHLRCRTRMGALFPRFRHRTTLKILSLQGEVPVRIPPVPVEEPAHAARLSARSLRRAPRVGLRSAFRTSGRCMGAVRPLHHLFPFGHLPAFNASAGRMVCCRGGPRRDGAAPGLSGAAAAAASRGAPRARAVGCGGCRSGGTPPGAGCSFGPTRPGSRRPGSGCR